MGVMEEPGNSVNGISIANNDVNTAFIGIEIIEDWQCRKGRMTFFTRPITMSCPPRRFFATRLDQAPTLGVTPASGIKGITVAAGAGQLEASGNQVQVYIADNLVAGVLGDASLFANLESGASGNSISTSATPTPAISFAANAEGESPLIAPNTWIEIKGVNPAPHQDALNLRIWTSADFLNNQMPVALDSVSATINGKSAFVWYVSPSQVNVLTPPDAISGSVNVVVTNNGASNAP